jgi:hypothetical protein
VVVSFWKRVLGVRMTLPNDYTERLFRLDVASLCEKAVVGFK